jgi:uncharacterized zinc-type alcohol dehydrogenase-like protein
MTTVHAYAATEKDGQLAPFEYELGELGAHEVDIATTHCGICHSDLSMLEDAWGMTSYPLVPGHEVIGTVAAVGDHARGLAVGDKVGLGWHAGYCMTCDQCMSGDHNMCGSSDMTIVARHGGFADRVRAQDASVIKLPEGLDAAAAGPLLCAGITVFNPLVQFNIPPTAHVGVIGIGGLGHLAVQFARAWGCQVTAITSRESKRQEAMDLGAHDTIVSRNADEVAAAEGRFDLLLSTVNVKLDWNAFMATLKPRGRLHVLGALLEPLDVETVPMLFGQKEISGSPVGSPATIRKMLEFAARHGINPMTEHFPLSEVNAALDHLRAGKARFRIVLDV